MLNNGKFPDSLKKANITPIFKMYRPISMLPNLSKIYERIKYDQLSDCVHNILSKFIWGFRKAFGAQDCLLVMETF